MTLTKYGFDFWLLMSMRRSDFSLENAEDIDGEVVASLVCQSIEDEISVLKAFDSDRTGIWKLPESWISFYIYSHVDRDYAFLLDTEFCEGKVLESTRFFDVKLLMDIDGRITIESDSYNQARESLQREILNNLSDCVDSNCDDQTRAIFNSGVVLDFQFESLDEEDDGEFEEDDD
jgi:hypothetical protein